jgi:uncharacterized protein YbaA (DUF1428 family)
VDATEPHLRPLAHAPQQPDETVVFSWIIWPDKATHEAAEKKIMTDERMKGLEMPFDGRRMIVGGFSSLFDSEH